MAENSNLFKLSIITPDRVFYENDVHMVEMPTSEGPIGVYKMHVPTTCIVSPGVVYIHEAGEEKKAAIYSGFAEILQNEVRILAQIAEWPEEIDVNRAEEAKIRAERRLKGNDASIDSLRAELALRRALVRLELAGK